MIEAMVDVQGLINEAQDHPDWDRFVGFDEENPHVFDLLVSELRRVRNKGGKKTSIKRLVENLRWQDGVLSDVRSDIPPVRLPNAFTALYSRAIAFEHPELAGMFNYAKIGSK